MEHVHAPKASHTRSSGGDRNFLPRRLSADTSATAAHPSSSVEKERPHGATAGGRQQVVLEELEMPPVMSHMSSPRPSNIVVNLKTVGEGHRTPNSLAQSQL